MPVLFVRERERESVREREGPTRDKIRERERESERERERERESSSSSSSSSSLLAPYFTNWYIMDLYTGSARRIYTLLNKQQKNIFLR
jgi:hypothetical protein